ncbi:DUF397 domain-containing protein [Actinoplanes sp. CA-142083]|uniref:DUF397 domain-containing protein n=1 Tax=Actinoplanes sp. CA-142083 TaxID=3239903 RepID=UPI003D8F8B71
MWHRRIFTHVNFSSLFRCSLTVDGGHRLEVQKLNRPTKHAQWQRSSRCGTGTCVEVAEVDGQIWVRDSKAQDGPALSFTKEEWTAFVDGVADGEFRY